MEPLTGKKIFVLYPDEDIRDIFYGSLRNQFAIYYMYDYEKVKALLEYYPGSIIIMNLVNNELGWLPEEINGGLKTLPKDNKPKTIALYDNEKPLYGSCTRSIQYQGNREDLKAELKDLFVEYGGRGRRNFVRYGGSGEEIASMKIVTKAGVLPAIVHDISASGLSCSIAQASEIDTGIKLAVRLILEGKTVEFYSTKILERKFGENPVHVLKFEDSMSENAKADLLHFIYSSLDSKMQEFIKNLSN
ncbi:MAG TPA: hypothetical protein DCO79_07805 [Spirochaeta sp.]|nr:hypothetical protein [Spirochaeta sp.]